MSTLSMIQWLHPENLNDSNLIEILLMQYCIDIKDIKVMKRVDLMKLFRKVALPLPQRQYSDKSLLGKKLAELRIKRNIPISTEQLDKSKKFLQPSQSNELNNSELCQKTSFSNNKESSFLNERPRNNNTSNHSEHSNRHFHTNNRLKRTINDSQDQINRKRINKISWP